jgi:hypothetical protein
MRDLVVVVLSFVLCVVSSACAVEGLPADPVGSVVPARIEATPPPSPAAAWPTPGPACVPWTCETYPTVDASGAYPDGCGGEIDCNTCGLGVDGFDTTVSAVYLRQVQAAADACRAAAPPPFVAILYWAAAPCGIYGQVTSQLAFGVAPYSFEPYQGYGPELLGGILVPGTPSVGPLSCYAFSHN